MTDVMTVGQDSPEAVYVANRLHGDSPEIACLQVKHMLQIHDELRLDEELAGAEEKFQAELERRREEAAAPPAVEQEVEAPSLDSMEADAHGRIEALTEQRQHLSLDATRDEDACLALSEVEADIEAAETEIERIKLARVEAKRRAPIEAAEREEKQKLIAAMEKEAARLPAAAEAVDAAADVLAAAVTTHREIARRTREKGEAAGIVRPALFAYARSDSGYELALRFALGKHDVGDTVERPHSPLGHMSARPLAEPAGK